jgi:hypothetical protein
LVIRIYLESVAQRHHIFYFCILIFDFLYRLVSADTKLGRLARFWRVLPCFFRLLAPKGLAGYVRLLAPKGLANRRVF